MKSRKEKLNIYEEKYKDIPKDNYERLCWMYDKYNINDKKAKSIINARQNFINDIYYTEIKIILYEEPEGSPRPRFRIVNRQNLINEALSNSNFVHVYSITGKEDNMYMKRLMNENDFIGIENMICTPCDVEYCTYFPTPKSFSIQDKFLAEIGLIRHISKPDWDNIGKKYSDMSNRNIWLDDTFVIDGTVRKFYSILPRIEIRLLYSNKVFNKYQYNSIINRVDYPIDLKLNYFKGE